MTQNDARARPGVCLRKANLWRPLGSVNLRRGGAPRLRPVLRRYSTSNSTAMPL